MASDTTPWMARAFVKPAIAAVIGLAVGALSTYSGVTSFIDTPVRRERLAYEFLDKTTDYELFAWKAWLDADQRGHRDWNKSDDMERWEDELYPQFVKVLEKVGIEFSSDTEVLGALGELRCANTKFFFSYEVREEDDRLSQVVNDERLNNDCNTGSWDVLDRDLSPTDPDLAAHVAAQYHELQASRSAVQEILLQRAGR